MQTAFCAPGAPAEVPLSREIVPPINALTRELRKLGCPVIWVVHANISKSGRSDWELFFNHVVGDDVRERTMEALAPGNQTIWGGTRRRLDRPHRHQEPLQRPDRRLVAARTIAAQPRISTPC